ncbi:MAG: phytanoyl-CoA dioxygenase family protein [Myxococcota bacterium]
MKPAPPVTMITPSPRARNWRAMALEVDGSQRRLQAGPTGAEARVSERVTPAEREQYEEQGFFVRPALFGREELAPLREAVEGIHDAVVAEGGRPGAAPVEWIDGRRYQELLGSTIKWEWREDSREIRSMEPFAHLDPRLDALIDDPRLWSPASDLLRSGSVSLFTDKLNFKRPRGAPFPWHQDAPYWVFGCDHVERLSSLQIYLDDARGDNGCLWMIPGTHTQGNLPVFEDQGVLGRLYTDLAKLGPRTPVPIEAPAGSVIFFDGYVVHGSRRNRSDASRRALVLTYQPAGFPRWRAPGVRPIASPRP